MKQSSAFTKFTSVVLPLFGALSLLSVWETLVKFDQKAAENVLVIIDSWRSVVRPITSYIFSPVIDFFNLNITDSVKDYLTVGLVFTGMLIRFLIFQWRNRNVEIVEEDIRQIDYGIYIPIYNIWTFTDKLGLSFVNWPILLITMPVLWPIWSLAFVFEYRKEKNTGGQVFIAKYGVFWRAAVYFLILLMVTYFFIYKSDLFALLLSWF